METAPIVGHKEIRTRLRQAVKNGQVASAYLFAGPEGVGKKLVALEFARALQADVRIISKEEKTNAIKIEQVRELQAEIMLRPLVAKYKVFIIDNAHILTKDAANCLLKTLEEPPGDSVLVLVSANPAALLPTILSRCQRINFLPLTAEEMAGLLPNRDGLDKEQLSFLATFAQGSMGLAEHYLQADIFAKKKEWDEFVQGLPGQSWENIFNATQKLSWDKEGVNLILDLMLYHYARGSAPVRQDIVDSILQAKQNMFRNINLRLTLENIFLRIKNA